MRPTLIWIDLTASDLDRMRWILDLFSVTRRRFGTISGTATRTACSIP